MKNQEITILGKSYSFFTDEPEYLAMLGNDLTRKLEELKEKYSQFSRDHLLLLYLLRKEIENSEGEDNPQHERAIISDQEAETNNNDEQLGLEIDDILNTEL